jgi:PAS domain-containing protein
VAGRRAEGFQGLAVPQLHRTVAPGGRDECAVRAHRQIAHRLSGVGRGEALVGATVEVTPFEAAQRRRRLREPALRGLGVVEAQVRIRRRDGCRVEPLVVCGKSSGREAKRGAKEGSETGGNSA